MFRRAGSLIKLSPRYKKSEDVISALRVRQICQESIAGMCRDYPEDLVKKIKVTTYKNGVLTIVTPTIVGAELHMRSGELVDAVNKKVARKILKDIRFRVG